MSSTVSKSFRLDVSQAEWIGRTAKMNKTTQTAIIQNCIQAYKQNGGIAKAQELISKSSRQAQVTLENGGNIEADSEDWEVIQQIGLSSVAGITGYYISKGIRNHLEYADDKEADILIGLIAGLGVLFLQNMRSSQ